MHFPSDYACALQNKQNRTVLPAASASAEQDIHKVTRLLARRFTMFRMPALTEQRAVALCCKLQTEACQKQHPA